MCVWGAEIIPRAGFHQGVFPMGASVRLDESPEKTLDAAAFTDKPLRHFKPERTGFLPPPPVLAEGLSHTLTGLKKRIGSELLMME